MLDADTRGAAYYLIFATNPKIWPLAYERVIVLKETDQYLLGRATPAEAEVLPGLGFNLQRLFLPLLGEFSITPDSLIQSMNRFISL